MAIGLCLPFTVGKTTLLLTVSFSILHLYHDPVINHVGIASTTSHSLRPEATSSSDKAGDRPFCRPACLVHEASSGIRVRIHPSSSHRAGDLLQTDRSLRHIEGRKCGNEVSSNSYPKHPRAQDTCRFRFRTTTSSHPAAPAQHYTCTYRGNRVRDLFSRIVDCIGQG